MSLEIDGSINTITGVDGLILDADVTVTGNLIFGATATTSVHDLTGRATITADSGSAALTISQSGAGSAFLVEDATSDSTPFVITTDGTTVVGHTAPWAAASEKLQVVGAGISVGSFSANTSAYSLNLVKSRHATPGSHTVVVNGDDLGRIDFYGDDGTTYVKAASIKASVDATPGTNDMPGNLIFLTSADGSATPVEHLRISNAGLVTVSGETKLSSSHSTTAALQIIQTGTGNALLVEDSASTDTSPFVIDASGRVLVGYTSNMDSTAIQVFNNTTSTISYEAASSSSAGLNIKKSRSTVPGVFSVVQSGDSLGGLYFFGDDSAVFRQAATITAAVDDTASSSDMPGRLMFSTTLNGEATPTERMRIDNVGNLGIGVTTLAGYNIRSGKMSTGAVTAVGLSVENTVQADVTTAYNAFQSVPSTLNSSFTLTSLRHYYANQGTKGASNTITNQFGFVADSTLTGATNNYGFYGNIASGSNRFNFYAAGTADNFLAGSLGVGTVPTATSNLYVNKQVTGGTAASALYCAGQVQSGTVTSSAIYINTLASTSAGTTTALYHFKADQGTLTGTVTSQYGYAVDSTLIGGTNNFGFHSNIASTANRWNFYAAGTANNAYAGNSSFGKVTAPIASVDATSVAKSIVTSTASTYTVLATDHTIIQTTQASTYTLPAAASFTGRILHLVTQFAGTVISASSNVVPLAGGAAGTAILAATAGKFATLQSDGTNWVIIAAN